MSVPPPKGSESTESPKEAKKALTVKQLATYTVAAAAFVAAIAGLGSHVGDWLRWGLGIDTMQVTITEQREQIEDLKRRLQQRERLPDTNQRLDAALPRIANALRTANKDLRGLRHAVTRLATIHEFGLDQRRARETAQEVQHRLRSAADEADAADESDSAMDALEGL